MTETTTTTTTTTTTAAAAGPPKKYEFHPLADLFPTLDKDSHGFKALIEDIKANGQHQPVWLLDGKILDGKNRYSACQHLGRDVATREYIGGDPIGFVLSINLHRRHLNTSQRAMVAAKLANFTHGGDRSKPPIGGLTDAAVAKLLNVGERSVERARQVLAKGDPSAVEEVEQGKTSVTEAAETATGKGKAGKGKTGKGKEKKKPGDSPTDLKKQLEGFKESWDGFNPYQKNSFVKEYRHELAEILQGLEFEEEVSQSKPTIN